MYLASNNLYVHSIIQFLPTEKRDWVNPRKFNLENCFNNGSISCFLGVDFECPDELHGFHNDYPLTPGKK